ncbi:MAG TPA: HXXEE domain-containing protein [Candidatus Krumholzibacteria bacterium]|nr:HXXEE domain-containing protein [Candidatus Krumholzibacteria bacterium]
MNWLYGTPLIAASLHICEEFLFPGGFAAWDRRYRPAFAASITPRLHIIVNALLLILCYDVWALRGSSWGTLLWFVVAALLFTNALWHVRGAWKTRSYSPGMVTGLALYVPLTLVGAFMFVRHGAVPPVKAALAFAVGASYPLVSHWIHRRRSRRMA